MYIYTNFWIFLAGRRSSTPASADDIHQGSAPQTPQERRRFGFGKYFERSNKTDRTNTASSNDVNADISTPKSGKKPKTWNLKFKLRKSVFENLKSDEF